MLLVWHKNKELLKEVSSWGWLNAVLLHTVLSELQTAFSDTQLSAASSNVPKQSTPTATVARSL